MRKTLLLSEIFPPQHGGSGRWFWEIYTRLPSEQVTFVVGRYQGDESFDSQHHLNLHRIPLSSASWGFRSFEGLRFYFRSWKLLRKYVKHNNIEEVHCGRCLPEGVIAWLLNLTHGIDYSCYVHGEDIETAASSRELSLLVRQVLKNSSRLICNSQNTASILSAGWAISDNRITVMHPGVDVDKFTVDQDIRKPPNWDNKTVILTVGRLQKRKGQDVMIKALPKILETIPNTLYCIIGDGKEKENLHQLVASLDLIDHVEFRDEIKDEEMIACYQHCDLFALPNRTVNRDIEGFGIVLLEAQACGKPVLAGDSGGTKETMLVNETGVVVDCSDADNLAIQVSRLLSDKDRLHAMGASARNHVVTKFRWENLAHEAFSEFSKPPNEKSQT